MANSSFSQGIQASGSSSHLSSPDCRLPNQPASQHRLNCSLPAGTKPHHSSPSPPHPSSSGLLRTGSYSCPSTANSSRLDAGVKRLALQCFLAQLNASFSLQTVRLTVESELTGCRNSAGILLVWPCER
ncbi:hypothetical protein E2320_006107 [Naja naja]|nr:hypothetical protein E2320_006107 [Naja naja]